MADPLPKSLIDDNPVIKSMREKWTYATDEWRAIREEARVDMRYCAGDAWEPADRAAREAANRPCISLDELSQYTNQLINEVRQNKRAIQVTPLGSGANDKTARFRSDLIRQIEYRSNAQQAYTTMFENAVQRSYGFTRIKAVYENARSRHQELIIEALPNPDLVTLDPDAQKPTGADMGYAWVRESWAIEDYKRRWPKAVVRDYTAEWAPIATDWMDAKRIQVAEYWTVTKTPRKLIYLDVAVPPVPGQPPQPPMAVNLFEDEIGKFLQENRLSRDAVQIVGDRMEDERKVTQYLTNGFEVLEEHDWPGTSIPIIACYGKVLYIDEGSGSKRNLLSLIRLARDPAMLYAYLATAAAETVGGVTKNAWIGYKGQFRGMETGWQQSNHQPTAYLEVNPLTEATGATVLPLPKRESWDPPLQNLLLFGDFARRAIQAAIGSMPLPTQAQRVNEKSGIALQKIQDTSQRGQFHFIDHYEDAITECGRKLDELIPKYYDAAREVALRDPKDAVVMRRINDPSGPLPKGQTERIDAASGDHDVTLSTGPAKESEREQANEFADLLIGSPVVAQIVGPQKAAQLLALAIKLKNVGPLGDEMAEIVYPTQEQNPEQMQQQLAEASQIVQVQQAELAELKQAQAVDAIKAKGDLTKAAMDNDAMLKKATLDEARELKLQAMKDATAIATAHIAAASKGAALGAHAREEAQALGAQGIESERARQHELGMSAEGRAHEVALTTGDRAHQTEMAERGHQQALEANEQQAALQPPAEGV